jgi:predicted membrane-bound spermidine synthase
MGPFSFGPIFQVYGKLSVIWTKTTNDAHFEVRRAGCSVRLYRNGVFHSQYNSRRPIAANLWNLLLIPAYFRPVGTIRRALVLGVGGGAVIRLLQHCIRPDEIVGVELDPMHVFIARRFFGVAPSRANLVQADAVDWLRCYKGPKFDLIIDDLYGEAEGEPMRAVEPDKDWLSILSRNLSNDGVLVMNFISSQALRDSSHLIRQLNPTRLNNAFRLSLPAYENVVGAFVSQALDIKPLRQLLRASASPCGVSLGKLPYRIRRISQ